MPIAANPDGVLDIENATLRSREIATLSNFVAGNDEIRSSGAPVVEVYGDPANVGGLLPTLELVSNTESVTGTSFTRFTSNAGVFTLQSGTDGDADSKGDIAFSSVGGDTEHMRIQGSTGNVGIGTVSPGAPLDIYKSGGGEAVYAQKIQTDNASTASTLALGPGIGFYQRWWSSGGVQVPMAAIHCIKTQTDGTDGGGLAFRTGSGNLGTRMVINHNGNVGIGKTNPNIPLDVGNALENPRIGRDLIPGEVHDADKRDSIYFGRRDGSSADFLGMKCRVDTHTALGYGSYSNQTKIEFHTWGNSYAGSREVMCIRGDGNVGIGTAVPYAKLHVYGLSGNFTTTGTFPSRATYFINNSGLYINTTADFGSASIYGSNDIIAGGYIASFIGTINASDTRIKTEIVDVEDGSALETLRLLKPKKYKYIDKVKQGTEPVWGFIAQEVRDTLPYASQLRRECVPNIYELANVSASNVITFSNFDTSNLESNAMVLKVFDKDDMEHLVNITEVVDDHSVRVEEDLSEWTGSVDESGNVVAGNQLFVYGQRVDDFVFLKKDAIWTVATSALQEVDRQLQAEKTKVTTLETQLASVLTRLDALESA
jgi:hypothetical protein